MQLCKQYTQPQHPVLCAKRSAGVTVDGHCDPACHQQAAGRSAAKAVSLWQASALDCIPGEHYPTDLIASCSGIQANLRVFTAGK